jgi:transposase-like protein
MRLQWRHSSARKASRAVLLPALSARKAPSPPQTAQRSNIMWLHVNGRVSGESPLGSKCVGLSGSQYRRPSRGWQAMARMSSMIVLPSPNTKRWVARRKAAVVAGVSSGMITLEEACRRYQMSEEEFFVWQRAFETFGLLGLRASRVQQHHGTLPSRRADPAPRRASHSARIPPQRSKTKTAKRPNRERRTSAILPTVTHAVPA